MSPARKGRPRIDLDGVPLRDAARPDHPAVVVFRFRSTEGLVLLIPESADVLVPWDQVEDASLDLASGAVRVRLASAYVERHNWLRGAAELSGQWVDRYEMTPAEDVLRT